MVLSRRPPPPAAPIASISKAGDNTPSTRTGKETRNIKNAGSLAGTCSRVWQPHRKKEEKKDGDGIPGVKEPRSRDVCQHTTPTHSLTHSHSTRTNRSGSASCPCPRVHLIARQPRPWPPPSPAPPPPSVSDSSPCPSSWTENPTSRSASPLYSAPLP